MYLADIGSYRLLKLLAEGGFGAVYCGENKRTGYKVAIKLLHKHLSENEEMQKRFQREVSILQSIRHPHIVNVYDAGMIPTLGLFLVMEWLEGETLKEYVNAKPQRVLTPQEALPLFCQLLEGLSQVHDVGIIHRDLKPQNLMLLEGQGQLLLKILDFGIAQSETAKRLTQTDGSIGTPDFMAPEQITRGLGPVGPETDLYAVGLLLTWVLTGKMPFSAPTTEDAFLQKLQSEPPSLRQLGEHSFPDALERVVQKLLQKRPMERYPSAILLLKALQQAIPEKVAVASLLPTQQPLSTTREFSKAASNDTSMMEVVESAPTPESIPPESPSLVPSPLLRVPQSVDVQAAHRSLQPPGAGYHPEWYISRPNEEERTLAYLAGPGAPAVLWGPELLGKTWMLKYLTGILKAQGNRVVEISFKRFDEGSLSSLNNLLQELALHISEELEVPEAWFSKAWKRPGNPLRKFTWLMGQKILPSSEEPLVLIIDRIDAVQGRPFSDDFFGMLRSWSEDSFQSAWSKLRLLMAISTTPTLLTERSNQSPFNLTPPVYLGDFGIEQLEELAARYQLPWGHPALRMILEAVGGHPYLVRLIMYYAAAHQEELSDLLNPQHGLYQPYLNRYRKRLQEQPKLGGAMRSLVEDPSFTLKPELFHHLYKAGLVISREDGRHELRYSLYKELL